MSNISRGKNKVCFDIHIDTLSVELICAITIYKFVALYQDISAAGGDRPLNPLMCPGDTS